MNETIHPEWIVRELRLTDLCEPSAPPRTLRHFHLIGWPDFGVPERPQALIQFVRIFRQRVPPSLSCKPTVVHCR